MNVYFKYLFILIAILTVHSSFAVAGTAQTLCRSYFAQNDVLNKFSQAEKIHLETAASFLADLIGKSTAEHLQAKFDINANILNIFSVKKLSPQEILEFKLWFEKRIQFYSALKKELNRKTTTQAQLNLEKIKDQKNENQKIHKFLEEQNAKDLTEALFQLYQSMVFDMDGRDRATLLKDILFILDRYEQIEVTNVTFQIIVQFDHFSAVEYFIQRGVDLDFKDEDGNLPLHLAVAYNSNSKIIKLLLQAGNTSLINIKGHDDSTPLHFAASNSNIEILKLLLDAGADATLTDKNLRLPLHYAARNSHMTVPALQNLLGMTRAQNPKLDPINVLDISGEALLHFATESTNIEVVKTLLEAGADPSLQNKAENTPLHLAAARVNAPLELLQILIAAGHGAQLNIRNAMGNTPLHVAASENSNADIIKLLIEYSYDNLSSEGDQGHTPLDQAIRFNLNPEVVRILVEADQGAQINPEDYSREPPLVAAITESGFQEQSVVEEVVEFLLNAGADPTVTDDNGTELSMLTNSPKIKRLLKSAQDAWKTKHPKAGSS